LLAVLDVTRKLAGDPLRRLRTLPDATPPAHAAERTVLPPRADRRAAANTLAEASARKPYRVADHS
jgi:hypothetical protein